MPISTAKEIPRALLVSIKVPSVSEEEAEDSVRELERLVTTLGFEIFGVERQRMPNTTGATAVGAGLIQMPK